MYRVQILRNGDKPASEIKESLKEKGYSASTISEAKKELGVESVRDGEKRLWRLPSNSELENTGNPEIENSD